MNASHPDPKVASKQETDGSAIRVVLFDVGGVLSVDLIETKLSDLARKYALPEGRLLEAGLGLRREADLGEITDEEFWRIALERFGVLAGPEDVEIESYMHEIEGTLDVARELVARGLRVGILSNDTRGMALARRRKHGFDAVFAPIFISSELGLVKPEPGIYDHALASLGLRGDRCLFIDNRDDNVEAARQRGMRAIVFVNAGELRRELEAIGLL